MKSPKSLIPKSTTADVANSCTMYVGQVTKVPTKKLHGYQPQSLIMHKNSLQTSTLAILENPDPLQLNSLNIQKTLNPDSKTKNQVHYLQDIKIYKAKNKVHREQSC